MSLLSPQGLHRLRGYPSSFFKSGSPLPLSLIGYSLCFLKKKAGISDFYFLFYQEGTYLKDRLNDLVLAKKTNLIISLLPLGIVATIINSSIISVLMWNIIPRVILFGWIVAQLFFAVLRIFFITMFKVDTKKVSHVKKNVLIISLYLTISGFIWGSSAFFGLLHSSFAHQMTVAVVLGGMCAGAATIYSALRESYYGFSVPTLVPQIVVFLIMGTPIHLALAIMLVLFIMIISFSAESNYSIITSNFKLVFKNEDLIAYLRDSNKKAQLEIAKRKQVETELLKSRNELEEKVKNRTIALSEANEGLKTQIEKRIKVEDELRKSENYYRSIVDTAQEGIWIIDENHRIYYTNQRMAQLLDFNINELKGKDVCEFLDEDQKIFHGADRRVRGIRQINLHKSDGTLISVIESESSLFDAAGQFHSKLGMVTDITEHKNWEKKIVKLNSRLKESNRELSEFSHSVSHDLRAPLHTIRAFSELIQDEYSKYLDDNAKKYLSIIKMSSDRMNELIGDLLTLSKVSRTELHRQNVNLSIIAKDVLNTLHGREPMRIVRIKIQENVFANCDPGLIKIVIENLLSNSWKFTNKKDDPEICFGADFKGNIIIYHVSDNGAGFDMKYKEKIFQPFHRLHGESEYEGTGIGLATVYRIVKRHGGVIWAEAIKNKGATFYFTL